VLFYNVAICTIKTVYVDKPALNVCFDNVSIVSVLYSSQVQLMSVLFWCVELNVQLVPRRWLPYILR